jgi:hypothetical protein
MFYIYFTFFHLRQIFQFLNKYLIFHYNQKAHRDRHFDKRK